MPPIELTPPLVADGDRYFWIRAADVDRTVAARTAAALTSAFGSWPSFALDASAGDHLRWKLAKPGSEQALLSLTEQPDGAIIATSVLLPRDFRVRGRHRLVADWCDAAVTPAFQGTGYYTKRRAYTEQLDPFFNATINYSRHPRVMRTRRRRRDRGDPANSIRVMVRWLGPLAPPRALQWRSPRGLRDLFAGLALRAAGALTTARHRRAPPIPPSLTVAPTSRFDERLDRLFEVAADAFDFIEVRDSRFLNWRFAHPDGGEFLPVLAEEHGAIVGYAVFALRANRLVIADLLTVPDRPEVASALVSRALEVGRAARVSAVSCWLARRHPYRSTLQRHGFVDTGPRTGINVRVIALPPAEAALFDDPHARLHLMQGDTDSV